MKIKEVYFEEIFYDIFLMWKEEFELEFGNKSKSFVPAIRENFQEVEYTVEIENLGKKYNQWHFFMVFTSYQVLTEIGLEYLKNGKTTLLIKDIPIAAFEKQFLENLQFEGNEKYLKKYKGLKMS